MFSDSYFEKFILPDDLRQALSQCRSIAYIETQEELDELLEAAQGLARLLRQQLPKLSLIRCWLAGLV